jgi:thiamine biosynthesis lipoprotein
VSAERSPLVLGEGFAGAAGVSEADGFFPAGTPSTEPVAPAVESRWRAMGTEVQVLVEGDPWLVVLARNRVADLESRWSRFLPMSEVSRLNRAAGQPIVVSDETTRLLQAAVEGWQRTEGLFDPTVLGDVVRAGYDRTFADLPPDRREAPPSRWRRGAETIRVGDGLARLAKGVAFDPGGIGKGLAADIVAAELVHQGAERVLVDIGGDLRVAGRPPAGGWSIALPDGGCVRLDAGGVATSGASRRRWLIAGSEHHHLIDPRTGRPAALPADRTVTVLAAAAWQAEVLATAAIVAGPTRGEALVRRAGAHTAASWPATP